MPNVWSPDIVLDEKTKADANRFCVERQKKLWQSKGKNMPYDIVEVGGCTVLNVGMYTHGMLDLFDMDA